MNPISKKQTFNGNTPANQDDLATLAGEVTMRLDRIEQNMATKDDISRLEARIDRLDSRLDGIENRMVGVKALIDGLDSRMDSLERGQSALLKTMTSIDQQLKEWQHIPAKVERLHTRVFRT